MVEEVDYIAMDCRVAVGALKFGKLYFLHKNKNIINKNTAYVI